MSGRGKRNGLIREKGQRGCEKDRKGEREKGTKKKEEVGQNTKNIKKRVLNVCESSYVYM